jgi:hypothetical protein
LVTHNYEECSARWSHFKLEFLKFFFGELHETFPILIVTSVACVVGPSVNPLQNRETQLRAQLPLPSLWHVASTKGQFVFHDLPFI